MWPHAVPILRACGIRGTAVWRPLVCFAPFRRREESAVYALVGVDAAVAKERPVAADVLKMPEVNLRDQDFFAVGRCFRNHHALRVSNKRRTPELDSGPVTRFFVPD